jgi:predicted nucleotidyltransferase
MAKKTDLGKARSFLRILRESGIRVDALYLYGSRAKGTYRKDSDMDVAVISTDFSDDPVKNLEILLPVLKKADVAIETTSFHPEDFREEHPLVWEILRSGIRIA